MMSLKNIMCRVKGPMIDNSVSIALTTSLPIKNTTQFLNVNEKNDCLSALGKTDKKINEIEILPLMDLSEAAVIAKEIKDLTPTIKKYAVLSGGLAGFGNFFGLIPFGAGVPVAAAFSFAANYQGFMDGTKVSNKQALIGDTKQDLLKNTKHFYKDLATHLLFNYINADRVKESARIKKASGAQHNVIKKTERRELREQRQKIKELAGSILQNIRSTALGTQIDDKVLSLDERKKILRPLKEVCEFITNRRASFSRNILTNALQTFKNYHQTQLLSQYQNKRINELENKLLSLQQQVTEIKNTALY